MTDRPSFWSRVLGYFTPPSAGFSWAVIVPLLVLLVFGFILVTKGPFLDQLVDPARVRGLITVSITFGTIFFALILIVQAFVGADEANDKADARFRRAREIFTVLAGILGTIVGFYFGSAEREAADFVVSGARIVNVGGGGAVVAQVENGTPPYHYKITFSNSTLSAIERDLASPGWIYEPVDASSAGTALITVTDNRHKQASAKATFSAPPDSKATPATTPPATPATTPPATQ